MNPASIFALASQVLRRARGWLWMLRKFGVRRSYLYWREGQRRGWMTQEQARTALSALLREDGRA